MNRASIFALNLRGEFSRSCDLKINLTATLSVQAKNFGTLPEMSEIFCEQEHECGAPDVAFCNR
jgi:hypothetical protein